MKLIINALFFFLIIFTIVPLSATEHSISLINNSNFLNDYSKTYSMYFSVHANRLLLINVGVSGSYGLSQRDLSSGYYIGWTDIGLYGKIVGGINGLETSFGIAHGCPLFGFSAAWSYIYLYNDILSEIKPYTHYTGIALSLSVLLNVNVGYYKSINSNQPVDIWNISTGIGW